MKKLSLLVSMLFIGISSQAAYQLNNEESSLNFVSTKNNSISENNTFTSLSGDINDEGQATINIDLASVETNIDIRNERMQQMLFNVAENTSAVVTSTLNMEEIASMEVGEFIHQPLTLNLRLNQVDKNIEAEISIIKLQEDQLLISSEQSILLNSADFGLDTGIMKLQEVAKLDAIAVSVPVNFHLHFSQ